MARKLTLDSIRRAAWPLCFYAVGQVLLVVGAWSIEALGSMLPMALASSAALMLMLPLLRHLAGPTPAPAHDERPRRDL